MSSSLPMELAIQRELRHRRNQYKVPCSKKEVVTTLTQGPSFEDWTNNGLISDATAQTCLALPNSSKVQSSLGFFSRPPSPSPGLQNPIPLKQIKNEPYSIEGPKSPISALENSVGPIKRSNEKYRTNNSSLGVSSHLGLGRRTLPPSATPTQETNIARFQSTNPFASVPTKLRSGLKRKWEENKQSSTCKKYVDSLVCEICQASCSSALAMQQHLKGRLHKAKIEWYKLQRDRDGPGTKKPMCNVCKIWCSDRDALEMHFKGQKHKSTVEARKRNGGTVIDKKPILCETCGIHCMNEDLFKVHLKGKQHAFKGKRML